MTTHESPREGHEPVHPDSSTAGEHTVRGRRGALWSMLSFSGLAMLSAFGMGQIRQVPPKPTGQPQSPPSPSLRETTGQTPWDEWTRAIMTATTESVQSWMQQATVGGVVINGPTALGGRFRGPRLASLIQERLAGSQVPADVARAFSETISAGWDTWEASLKFPGLPLFPLMAAVAGPLAPPTPSAPAPLVAMVMDTTPFGLGAFRDRIRAAVGGRANEDGAAIAIDRFAREFSARFGRFCASALLQIMGGGSVPSWAPPYVPVGPVVGGTNLPTPGIFLSGTF